MSAERFLVTGANGFIGSALTRRLEENRAEVMAAVGPSGQRWRLEGLSAPIVSLDVTDMAAVKELISRYRPSHILNLATYGVYRDQKDSEVIYRTNVVGVSNLLKMACESEIDLFVNTGSVFEYGSLPGAMKEEMRGETRNPYDEAKMNSTELACDYYQSFGLPVVTLRLFTTYGPYEDRRRMVAGTILRAIRGEEIVVGEGAIRDFVYINDVVEAYWSASTDFKAGGEVINIGSGQPSDVKEVAERICGLLESESVIRASHEFAPANDSRCWADITRAREILGWTPRIDIDRGLQETVEWYKTNLAKYSI